MIHVIMRLLGLARVNEAEYALSGVFASDPSVVEAVLMIRATPLSGIITRVVWQDLGARWQIDVQERNLKKRKEPVIQRAQAIPEGLFREVMSKVRQWAGKGKPKSGMIMDGAYYSLAWGTPGDINSLHVHVPTPDGDARSAIAYLEERML
jgi:hypothetical protein